MDESIFEAMSCQDVMSLLEQLPGTSETTQEASAELEKIKPQHFHGKYCIHNKQIIIIHHFLTTEHVRR